MHAPDPNATDVCPFFQELGWRRAGEEIDATTLLQMVLYRFHTSARLLVCVV
jgi:hypothetical protein